MSLLIEAWRDIINYMRADRAETGEWNEPVKSEQNGTKSRKV